MMAPALPPNVPAQIFTLTRSQCYLNSTLTITGQLAVVLNPTEDLPKDCSVFLQAGDTAGPHWVVVLKDSSGNALMWNLTEGRLVLYRSRHQWFIVPADDY